MDNLVRMLMEEQKKSGAAADNIAVRLREICGSGFSALDEWYKAGEDVWMRRTTDTDYLIAQVFPIAGDAHLCYLHMLSISDYSNKQAHNYAISIGNLPDALPADIQYMYVIGISQDIDSAYEKVIVSNSDEKNAWLGKMGIRGELL